MKTLPEFDLTDKVVFITGAGRGIGRGIAEVLSQAGADVAINALTQNHVESTANYISEKTGRRILPVLADVTSSDGVKKATGEVFKEFGRINVLINNIGDAIRHPLVKLPGQDKESISDDILKKIIDINMMATILCTRSVGPHMLERGSGKIINISSYTAGHGGGEVAIYSLAKAAVVGFTRTQALEWAPYNIQINSIAPGLFPEPMELSEEGKKNRQMGGKKYSVKEDRKTSGSRFPGHVPGFFSFRLHDRPDIVSGWRIEPLIDCGIQMLT